MATGKFNPENFGNTTIEQVSNFRYTDSEKKILDFAFKLNNDEFPDDEYFDLAFYFAEHNGLNDDKPVNDTNKIYQIRVYVFEDYPLDSFLLYLLCNTEDLNVTRGFSGVNGIISIYDVECTLEGLKTLIECNIKYFPLNHYEDFVITCPCCGERIDDDMIIKVYDENLLSGYNINCHRSDCGAQMAKVEFKLKK